MYVKKSDTNLLNVDYEYSAPHRKYVVFIEYTLGQNYGHVENTKHKTVLGMQVNEIEAKCKVQELKELFGLY